MQTPQHGHSAKTRQAIALAVWYLRRETQLIFCALHSHFALCEKGGMKRLSMVGMAAFPLGIASLLFCQTQPAEPTPAYVAHIPGVRVAAVSPDEKCLAAIVVHRPKDALPSAEVQVWDFRSDSMIRSRSLAAPELRPRHPEPTMILNYTGDGELLMVYAGGGVLRVLRASDLVEMRTIRIGEPSALKTSPGGHLVAVRAAGAVQIYDLDSGEQVRTWSIPPYPKEKPLLLKIHPRLDGPGLAWREDGKAVAISVADDSPCLRGDSTIYSYDLASEEAGKSFRVPLLAEYIAFGAGNRLYVASGTCGGYFTHWTLDLPIYDSNSGQEIGKIPAGRVGVRGYVAVSANKQVLVAYADREKTTFLPGLEDTLETKDEQWQVWDLGTAKLVMTLPARAHMPRGSYMAPSSSGRFVYAVRAGEVDVFSVRAGK